MQKFNNVDIPQIHGLRVSQSTEAGMNKHLQWYISKLKWEVSGEGAVEMMGKGEINWREEYVWEKGKKKKYKVWVGNQERDGQERKEWEWEWE